MIQDRKTRCLIGNIRIATLLILVSIYSIPSLTPDQIEYGQMVWGIFFLFYVVCMFFSFILYKIKDHYQNLKEKQEEILD